MAPGNPGSHELTQMNNPAQTQVCLSGIFLLEVDDLQDVGGLQGPAANLLEDGVGRSLGAHQRILHASIGTNELRRELDQGPMQVVGVTSNLTGLVSLNHDSRKGVQEHAGDSPQKELRG